ncbi:MAG: hypothetical protein QM778_06040 [Myxococcales bacterium]
MQLLRNKQKSPRSSLPPSLALALAVVLAVLSSACHATLAPVLSVNNAQLVSVSGQPLSEADARAIIMRALLAKHWTVLSESPGVIGAQATSRGHSATIRVDYTPSTYSISYVNSTPGLKYDGTNIHRLYNNWVKWLAEQIQKESAAGPGLAPAAAPAVVAPVAPAAPGADPNLAPAQPAPTP